MLTYEEFSGGNFTVGRGYDPGSITDDSGVGVTAEVRVGTIVPSRRNSFAIQPFAFFDAAWVWNEDSGFAGLNPQKLSSFGGGARVVYGDRAWLDIGFAEPLTRVGLPAARPDTRFLVSLTVQFGLAR